MESKIAIVAYIVGIISGIVTIYANSRHSRIWINRIARIVFVDLPEYFKKLWPTIRDWLVYNELEEKHMENGRKIVSAKDPYINDSRETKVVRIPVYDVARNKIIAPQGDIKKNKIYTLARFSITA